MEWNNKFKEGDWMVDDVGNIAIVDRVHHFFFEEFNNIPEGRQVGDYDISVVEYRVFCDFEGKPKKSCKYRSFNAHYCNPLDEESERILKKSIEDNPLEYLRFQKFLKVPKCRKGSASFLISLVERDIVKFMDDMKQIKSRLPSKFTFVDFQKLSAEYGITDFIYDFDPYDHSIGNIPLFARFYLDYVYGDFKGKRILFNKCNYEIRDNEALYWRIANWYSHTW